MRGTLAKRIRGEVYGDQSLKERRRYATDRDTGEVFCLGLRGKYQTIKQSVKEDRRKGVVR